jgi:hypothetical protein
MGVSWVVAAVSVAAMGLLIDPMGVSPIGVSIAGFNDRKPLRNQHDRIVKRLDVRRQQPVTIFMGSSRIKQTIDPRSVAATPFAPAYNAGMDGSADFGEVGTYLRYYLEHDAALRHVFFEAFPSALLSSSGTTPMTRFRFADDAADYSSLLFTMNSLEYLVRTLALNRQRPKASTVNERKRDGYAPIALAPHHFSVRNIFNQVLHQRILYRGGVLSPTIVATARQMIEECRSRGVECRFFLSPLHADALFAVYHLGLWPELEALKRGLAALGPTYDFTRYCDLIEERRGRVVYWPEAFHFSSALGTIVAQVMTGSRPPGVPATFGALLDAGNVEESLLAWRDERDRWIAKHPQAVERMRQAEENFLQGVSFRAVTEAEVAAGGW